jgi:hypothetical protein
MTFFITILLFIVLWNITLWYSDDIKLSQYQYALPKPHPFISLPLTNSSTNLLKKDWIIALLAFITILFFIYWMGTMLILLCIAAPLFLSFIVYKIGVTYISTNYIQLHNNTLCILVALVVFSILFILVSITILYYYEGLLNVHSYLLSLNDNFWSPTYLLDDRIRNPLDNSLRNPLLDRYNVSSREETGKILQWEAVAHLLKYGRYGRLSEIGLYGNGIYSKEFRHILPHLERWLHSRSFPMGSDISKIVCTHAFGWEVETRP